MLSTFWMCVALCAVPAQTGTHPMRATAAQAGALHPRPAPAQLRGAPAAGAPRSGAASSPAARQEGAFDAWRVGTIEVGALGGYARGKVFDPARTPTSMAQVLGRFAIHFGAIGSRRMRGNFALVAESVGAWFDQEPRAHGGGLNLLGRYAWAWGPWRPQFLFGAGIVFTDEQVPPAETTRNFTPQAGVGLQYLVADRVALGAEYRFHHLSNNGETETNPGINSHLILFGISWFH